MQQFRSGEDNVDYLCGLYALFNQDSWPGKQKNVFACVILFPSLIALNRQDAVCIPFLPNVAALCS